ncbi:MAG: TetR/AcrR family transcriptional regulator [Aquabacterium sp.]
MRYSKEHTQQVRRKLLSDSGSHAKKHGFAASGVDALAASAGVTIGSLYKHFASKEALFAEVIQAEMQRTVAMFASLGEGDVDALLKSLSAYASLAHVKAPEAGCPLPVLAAEVARAPDAVRASFEAGLLTLQGVLSKVTGSPDVAWALLAQSVGAVMLARAMHGEAHQKRLLSATRTTGAALVKSLGKGRKRGG